MISYYRYSPLDKASKTYLFYHSDPKDYTAFSGYFKNHSIDAIVDITNETDADTFSAQYLVNLEDLSSSPYTLITYSKDASKISSQTKLETLD